MIAESGRGGDGNRAARRDLDRWIDDVFSPIALAGGDITGERVAAKGRDGDVVNAADAAFQHATAPNRNIARQAELLDFPSARVAADTAELDVDDARGAEVNEQLRRRGRGGWTRRGKSKSSIASGAWRDWQCHPTREAAPSSAG